MNGIDAIYDPSDVRRMLAQLREQRLQTEDAKRRKTTGTTKAATTAWGMWNKEQSTRTKELLATEDYVSNPEYMKKGFISRSLTPSGGRVIPSEEFQAKLTGWESTGKYAEGGRASMRLPSGEIIGSAPIPKDVSGPKTIAESVGKTTEAIKGVSEKSFGSTLGKVASVAGAGLSAYDLATNWKKKSDVDKLLGTASTALYAGSIFNPALGIYALGTSILDQFWD